MSDHHEKYSKKDYHSSHRNHHYRDYDRERTYKSYRNMENRHRESRGHREHRDYDDRSYKERHRKSKYYDNNSEYSRRKSSRDYSRSISRSRSVSRKSYEQDNKIRSVFTSQPTEKNEDNTQNNVNNNVNVTNNPHLVSSLALLPTAVHTERKLYIGNLPNGITSPILVKMLNAALKSINPTEYASIEPIISAWINDDNHYGFIEFINADYATKGFVLNGFNFLGQVLKLGRPKTYQKSPPSSPLSSQTPPVPPPASNSFASLLLNDAKFSEKNMKKITFPTKLLCFVNIVKGCNLDDDDEYQFLIDDVKKECQKYGNVVAVLLPRKDIEGKILEGIGNAYVLFDDVEGSKRARKELSLRRFDNKIVTIRYEDEEEFLKKIS